MQLGTAIDTRRITLEKGPIAIHLALMVDARGARYNFWEVRLGGRRVKDGFTERTSEVAEVLKDVITKTTMRTLALDTALRALTWQALENHEHVPAVELVAGDVVNVPSMGGVATTVRAARILDSGIVVVELDGCPFERRFKPTALFNLTKRGTA